MKKVAIYIRCAVDAPYLELQGELEQLIKKQNDWEYVGAFVDVGYSGNNLDRPELRKLLAECKAGNVDIITVKHFASISRNTEDSIRLLETFQKTGVAVYQRIDDTLELIAADPAWKMIAERTRALRSEVNKRYERKHKAERKAKNATFGTSLPRERAEQITAFLKKYGYTKVELIEAGYHALLDDAAEHDLSLGKIMDGYDDFFGFELEQMEKKPKPE